MYIMHHALYHLFVFTVYSHFRHVLIKNAEIITRSLTDVKFAQLYDTPGAHCARGIVQLQAEYSYENG